MHWTYPRYSNLECGNREMPSQRHICIFSQTLSSLSFAFRFQIYPLRLSTFQEKPEEPRTLISEKSYQNSKSILNVMSYLSQSDIIIKRKCAFVHC